MSLFTRATLAVKAAARSVAMQFSTGRQWLSVVLGATNYDFRRSVGDIGTNTIILASVKWQQRTYPEAPMVVRQLGAEGDEPKKLPNHPLAALLRNPNPYYSGLLLWNATIADFTISGNAYWRKIRNAQGRVVQLWWIPSTMIEPRWPVDDPTVFISHYEYRVNNQITTIAPEDIVHFRDGIDPNNVRKGMSGVNALIREVATDNEAGNMTATLLRNVGTPGLVVTIPAESSVSQDDADEIKNGLMQRFSGDRKGETAVLTGGATVSTVSFSPKEMDLKDLRRVPEERCTAIIGIPAIVIGLGAGLDRSTYANYEEAREAAYESNVIPTQRLFAAEVQTQLVPDFGNPDTLIVEHDYSDVRVLQTDTNELHQRAVADLGGGLITLNQALAMIGEKALPPDQGDIRYLPVNISPVPLDDILGLRTMPARITVADPNATLPEPASDPNAPPPKPADLGILPAAPARVQLPAPKGRLRPVGRKAASFDAQAFTEELNAIRDALSGPLQRELEGFFAGQRERIVAAWEASHDASNVDALINQTVETVRLRAALEPHYLETMRLIQNVVQTQLGVRYSFSQNATQAYLRDAGRNISGITETTRQAVADALTAGSDNQEGIPDIAARLRDLPAFDRSRAEMVARTELAHAHNEAARANYRASGVVDGIRVLDGDGDDACAEADGTELTLDEADDYETLAHPNCVRSFQPIVSLDSGDEGDSADEGAA